MPTPCFHVAAGIPYFDCQNCDFIFAEPEMLAKADRGEPIRKYDDAYWKMELSAAEERSFGPAIARVAETLLYARIPVQRFLDIGTGAGRLLDALGIYLPSSRDIFYGIELFPPEPQHRSTHPNYLIGGLDTLAMTFQAGCCIEVIEHLTPTMLTELARELSKISEPESIFLFNTGLTAYVKTENIGYLDPVNRGHICIWSVNAARRIFQPHGFSVMPIPGKTWAFLVEYSSRQPEHEIRNRIWTALEHNKKILLDPEMGSVLYILGLESARAY
jgi:Methyltransferase domain